LNYVPGQTNTTGPAKWVNFGAATFAGTDDQNAIYYYTMNQYNPTAGVQFYKLYSKK
jgi:hypothetical protein